MENLITELAIKIDKFGKDYDLHGYGDAVDDEEENIKKLETDIANGDVEYLIDWHKETLEYLIEELTDGLQINNSMDKIDEIISLNNIVFNLMLFKKDKSLGVE